MEETVTRIGQVRRRIDMTEAISPTFVHQV